MPLSCLPCVANGDRLSRVTIASLAVWETATGKPVQLPPGVVLDACRTVRQDHGGGAYSMEFRTGGVVYRCPLYAFQPRTEVLEPAVEESAERAATLTSLRR